MPPKTRRQIAATRNYRKRTDRNETRGESTSDKEARLRCQSTSNEVRVGGESTSDKARVGDEWTSDEARVGGEWMSDGARVGGEWTSDGARVGSESMSDETRVGDEWTSNEVILWGEQSTSNDQVLAVKRPKLEDVSTLAAEPLQEWLDRLVPCCIAALRKSPKEVWPTED